MKTKKIILAYGIEVEIPDVLKKKEDLIEDLPATHNINDCGHHYNIYEKDEGFPQDRFYSKIKKGKEHE